VIPRILVIRLSALGDFVLSFGPFAAIREHHPDADITLLTTAPFAGLAHGAPWFDHVMIDERPRWWDLRNVARLARRLRGFDFVYDLQTSGRSTRYFALAGRPPWSGIAPGCSHRQSDPARETMHTIERQRDQLRIAGVTKFPRPDLSWLTEAETPELPRRFALLVPGAAPSRPAKRWPAARFGELAVQLAQHGVTPVVIGAASEADLAATIRAACPQAVDLTGRTSLAQIFAIASRAALAVGNDTGPMHIAASTGCRCVVLFSADSEPAMTAPRGPDGSWPVVLRRPVLAQLDVADAVAATLELL
jgi:ADP-heptose:LPS heptosyltransferase